MPTQLVPRAFDRSHLAIVGSLDCGSDQFGKIATDWIRCINPANCALQSIDDRGTDVFLYSSTAGELVGFGSLGKTPRNGISEEWSIIPQVGIAIHLRGHPKGVPWHDRYAAIIMLDLMSLALDHHTPTLMLNVHIDNVGARRLYDRLGFLPIGKPNAKKYQTMAIANCP